MTVDLSKAKAGDRVKFRCDLTLTVKKIVPMTLEPGAVTISWEEDYEAITYHQDGLGWANPRKHPLNIIKVIPKAFDWSEVKPGMAFRVKSNDKLVFYVGQSSNGLAVCEYNQNCGQYIGLERFFQKDLTRAPEHDIPMEAGE